jgi:hypothetical protein
VWDPTVSGSKREKGARISELGPAHAVASTEGKWQRPTCAAQARTRESRPSGLQAEQAEGELFSFFSICLFSKTFFK